MVGLVVSCSADLHGRHFFRASVACPSKKSPADHKGRHYMENAQGPMPELPLTEQQNPSTTDLDRLGTADLLHRINDEDRRVAWAVEREIDAIATAVDAIADRLRSGGRLHYFGAGTSGRLGVLDASEIPPTFSTPSDLVVGHIAGGARALTGAVEEAEDDERAGADEVVAGDIGSRDAVIGLSAGGAAPYVLGALRSA